MGTIEKRLILENADIFKFQSIIQFFALYMSALWGIPDQETDSTWNLLLHYFDRGGGGGETTTKQRKS